MLGAHRSGERLARIVLAHDLLDLTERQAERLAHIANRRTRPVGDHFGRHRRMLAAVELVHVLNHLLAVLMREVDVDVGHLAALFAQEALEEQTARDRIDRRDPERVAHRRVGGRTAALREHAEPFSGVRDIPDHQEIAGQIHPGDDAELVLQLAFHFRIERPGIPFACTAHHQRAQVRMRRRFVAGDREERKLPAQLVEPERAPLGDGQRVRDRARELGEEPYHLRRRLEMMFVIRPQQRPGALQRRAVLHAGQHVAEQPVRARRVRDPVRCDIRDVELPGQPHHGAQQGRIFGPHVMLQLEVEPSGEGIAQPRAQRDRGAGIAPQQRFLDDAVAAARQRDQAVGASVEIVEPQPRIAFAAAQLGGRNEPRQVAEAALVGREEHQARRVGRDFFGRPRRTAGPDRFGIGRLERQLGTAERCERRSGGGLGEADHPVQPIPVGQRDAAQP